MGFLDKLKFWKKEEPVAAVPAPPVIVPLPEAPPAVIVPPVVVRAPVPALVATAPTMSSDALQAEIEKLTLLIPQCSTETLKRKYHDKLEILVQRAQGGK